MKELIGISILRTLNSRQGFLILRKDGKTTKKEVAAEFAESMYDYIGAIIDIETLQVIGI